MAHSFELLNAVFCLNVGIIACSDRSHRGGLIARVALGTVLEVRVRSTRAVHTNVTSHRDMWASMWFRHDSDHSNTRCGSNWFSLEEGCKKLLVAFGQRCEDVDNLRHFGELVS